MNKNLQNILEIIQKSEKLDADQKDNLIKALKEADKEFEITCFKLDRTEKVKKTTAILLEETIEELEQKRKAVEAQNRELEIETALERVRAIALSMKEPADMLEVCRVISNQLQLLGVKNIRNVQTAIINEEKGTYLNYQYFSAYDIKIFEETKFDQHPKALELAKTMKKSADAFFSGSMKGKELVAFQEWRKKDNQFPDPLLDETTAVYYNFYSIGQGGLGLTTYNELPQANLKIFKRFHNVFTLAYRRFIDIELAIEKAREAQIEAALERVRAHAMGLRSSKELSKIITIIFEELNKLGLSLNESSIFIRQKNTRDFTCWTSSDSATLAESYHFPFFNHPILEKLWNDIERKVSYREFIIEHEELQEFCEPLFSVTDFKDAPQEYKDSLRSLEKIYVAQAIMKHGYLEVIGIEPLPEELTEVLKRFTNVIDLTYTRFLDLQQAEAQAREAQIEAALERVRSKAMAMHSSEDLALTVDTFFSELNGLNVRPHRCGVGIINEKLRTVDISANTTTKTNKIKKVIGKLKLSGHPVLSNIFKHWELQKEYHPVLRGNEIIDYYSVMNPQITFPDFAGDEIQYGYYFFFKEGGVFAWTDSELTEFDLQIFRRYTSVLSLTYRRYIDLKEAESQAREAKIETALERVRSRAMSMQSSEDLSATVNVFFKELKTLDIIPIRCGVGKIDEATRTTSLTTTTSSQQGESFEVIGKVEQTGHPVLDGIYENWKIQREYHPVLEGTEIKTYYGVMNKQIPYPDYAEDIKQYGNIFYFKEGFVFAWTENKLTEEQLQIFRRFTSVLSLTYRRYLDLQQAELRAREAEQQASLDRVRAEIASMRTTDDLEKITPLIWRELTTLGVPFFRCGVFIFDESISIAHAYLSTPLGKSLAALHVKIDKTWLENAVKHWRQGKIYNEVWDQEQFIAWTQTMIDQGFVESKEQFQAGKKAPEILYLQLLPFTQGMLYVGSKLQLSEEEIETAQKLADDFGVAYSRYEDFKKLEYANHRKSIELEEARQLQLAMLPKDVPQLPHLEIAVYMKTATEVGGDYYDFSFKEDGSINIAIGDATGHGMKAGIMVSSMKSIFTTNSSKMDIESFFTTANSGVKSMGLKRMMMGFTLLNINQDKFNLINAGMPPAFWYQKKRKKVEEIKEHGMPIGAMSLSKYKTKKGILENGDVLLLMTDGMPELKNGKKEMYGYNRIQNGFKDMAEKEPEDIISYLKNEGETWVNNEIPDDDVTFVVIKVKT